MEEFSFKIHIEESDLIDLKYRSSHVKWPADIENADWKYGVNKEYLESLGGYWANEYDWRLAEQRINSYPQYRIHVNGVPVHFIYQRGIGKNCKALILTHRWPWSFWDMHKIIGPLTNPKAFGSDDSHTVGAGLWIPDSGQCRHQLLEDRGFMAHFNDRNIRLSKICGRWR